MINASIKLWSNQFGQFHRNVLAASSRVTMFALMNLEVEDPPQLLKRIKTPSDSFRSTSRPSLARSELADGSAVAYKTLFALQLMVVVKVRRG